jgi:hypothetical protein
MSFASLLLATSVVLSILVSYLAAVRYFEHLRGEEGNFGVIGRRRRAQRITKSRLHWIKADELKRLIDADPELVVYHLLDDDQVASASRRFGSEISVTLAQLEEALPWMSRGTRFAVYRVDGITPELAQRLYGITQGRHALLLEGKFLSSSEWFDGRLAKQMFR